MPTPGTHEGRLIAACLRLGAHPHEDFRALRRWAHMLGYRGHFATKCRRYSTTMRVLRAARRDWYRRQQPTAKRDRDKTVVTITDLRMGWARLAHHRRRASGPVGRCPRPRAAAYRPRRDVRHVMIGGRR